MSTPVVIPPPGFQLQQNDFPAVEPPNGFELVKPPVLASAGLDLSRAEVNSTMAATAQQRATLLLRSPSRTTSQALNGGPPIERMGPARWRQTHGTAQYSRASSSTELGAGKRILQTRTARQISGVPMLAPPADPDSGNPGQRLPPLESAQTMLRYEQRVGNLPKPKTEVPAKLPGPEHLAPEAVRQFTDRVSNLPELERGNAMAQAHQLTTSWMLDRIGKAFMGPDHKLHIVKNPAEAEKLALKFINGQVDLRDKRLAQSTKTQESLMAVKPKNRAQQAKPAHSSQPSPHPKLTPTKQAEIAGRNAQARQRIANFPENIPPPDPEYVRLKEIYKNLPPEPELPEFELDPEQERRIQAQEERNASKSMVPNAAMPVLDLLNRYTVQPFEKAAQWGAGKGRSLTRSLVADVESGTAMADLPNEPEVTDEMREAYEHQQEEKRQKFIREHPRTMGVAGAIGSTVGGIATDPRNWPFFFSSAARPLLQKAITGGFAGLMTKGAINVADHMQQVWDDPNIPLEQKYEAITDSVLQAILAGGVIAHTSKAGRVLPLDAKLTEQLNHLPAAVRQEIFNRLQNKLKPPLSSKTQVTVPATGRAQGTRQTPAEVRKPQPSSATRGATAAQNIVPPTESLTSSSLEDVARINPHFKLDAINASLMRFEVIGRDGNMPPVLVLDPVAYQVVAKAYGRPVDGVNLSMVLAEKIIARVREQSATEPSRLIRKKLNSLTRKMEEIATREDGLSLVRDSGRTRAEFRAVQEELFHSVVQRRAGKGSIAVGTPHDAFVQDTNLLEMEPRMAQEGVTDHISQVAEAIHDVWANEAPELSPGKQSLFAEKYWEEAAKKNGDAVLFLAAELWQHLKQMARGRYNFDNIAITEVMNEKAFAALQRVISRRTRPQNQSVQEADQPPGQGILLQHRGREETEGDSGESEEPGTGTGGVERPPTFGQSVFLPGGRQATVQYISPKMKVAVVRLPDGQARTVKLSQIQNAPPGPGALPVMGRNMTAEAPSVRRVLAQARPVPGQVPEVKVKEEPSQVQNALAQRPEPVSAQDASRIGQTDAHSGRQVLQPSNSLVQNERLAADAAPELATKLSQVAASVPGARFDRLRPQKGLERLEEKVADGKPPSTIGDNLAAQIVTDTVAAKDQLIARLRQQFPIISVDDKFLEPREKAGYPSTNVQLQMPNGGTAEVQIVTPEIQAITDQTHRLYTLGRKFPEGSADRNWYWNQAAAMHRAALDNFRARNAQPSATTFAPGDKVALRNGQTGKVVGPSRDFRRVVVRTRSGLRTVKPDHIRAQSATTKGTPASPDFDPRDLKKFTGEIKSRTGAPQSQRGEIVLLNTDALHEIHKAVKDHSFAGVTLPGDMADDVIAKLRVRADKTGRDDLDLLADHVEQARSQYGVLPLALEGSNEAINISAKLEERIHGAQADMGKGDIRNYGDAERDYAHPVTQQFFPWLHSRGVDPNDKVMAVIEIAALVLRGDHTEAGVSDEAALDWLKSHVKTLRAVHGKEELERFIKIIGSAGSTIYEVVNEERQRED